MALILKSSKSSFAALPDTGMLETWKRKIVWNILHFKEKQIDLTEVAWEDKLIKRTEESWISKENTSCFFLEVNEKVKNQDSLSCMK